MNYKIWDKKENLITPIGEVLTPEQVFARYPAAALDGMEYAIVDGPISMGVFMNYDQLVDSMEERGVDFSGSEFSQKDSKGKDTAAVKQAKLDKIRAYETTPVVRTATAEERIAAAAEFANLLAMEDETV